MSADHGRAGLNACWSCQVDQKWGFIKTHVISPIKKHVVDPVKEHVVDPAANWVVNGPYYPPVKRLLNTLQTTLERRLTDD